MLQVFKHFGLDEIVILGDYADIYNLTGHGKDAGFVTSLVNEIEDVNAGLDELDLLFPKAKKVYLQEITNIGLSAISMQKCPELFGVTIWFFY